MQKDKYKGDIVNAVVSKIKYDIPDMFIDMKSQLVRKTILQN
jgi:hypothetical protein